MLSYDEIPAWALQLDIRHCLVLRWYKRTPEFHLGTQYNLVCILRLPTLKIRVDMLFLA